MSLPSKAIFYKDGTEVARIPCNCGWYWDGNLRKVYIGMIESVSLFGENPENHDNPAYIEACKSFSDLDSWDEMEAYNTRMTQKELLMKIDIDEETALNG